MIDLRFKKVVFFTIMLCTAVWGGLPPQARAVAASPEAFDRGIALLGQKDFTQKAEGIEQLAAIGDQRVAPILGALLDGNLFFLKSDGTLVIAREQSDGYAVKGALSGQDLGTVKKRNLSKISINNRMRVQLKSALARLHLSNPDPDVRVTALNSMMGSVTPENREFLTGLLAEEKNAAVREALQSAIAITVLRDGPETEAAARIAALKQLSGNLNPAVRNELNRLLAGDVDPEISKAARAALDRIESRLKFFEFFETFFFGLSLGSVLVLAAIGLAITFGVIGVINMAHGELIMIGAYTTYVMQQLMPDAVGVALIASIPAAFLVSALVGIAIERSVLRFLYGRPLETLLATFGVSLILQQAVRSIFSPLNRSVAAPDWMSGAIQINAVLALTTNRVVILIFTIAVFAGLALSLKKSAIGLQVRAVSQNRAMARALGVRAGRVDAMTFGLGSGIAGIAGVALSQLTNVGPNLGQAYIVDSFMVVVFGGVGNLWGTLLGGLSLGVINKFLEPWTGAVMAKIAILVFIILFIQKRPQGLFPQKGRAAAG